MIINSAKLLQLDIPSMLYISYECIYFSRPPTPLPGTEHETINKDNSKRQDKNFIRMIRMNILITVFVNVIFCLATLHGKTVLLFILTTFS